ncbi:16S rRNA (cytidine(1402)-2'-O)-methyltransferase [Floricoccus penangensis]|uniref:Ribosomal RNA small subunit methyltransferase I n=1 Tax=Floricoccus penangensis TaxID=1859475 RepID=A0A9Q5P1R2_9LACT|nr:16S rRNA (cytidine(1402)-2'-O)-methyltransferase [Floricoccus penangensis]OFI47581.1 16S rRNA (cytidine(1402)-2'-O)-methyltransferase [Floricoccus penangensis]
MQIQKSFKDTSGNGTLYLVPTPIGNMQDMTFRAVDTLKNVDLIASEDTRNTKKLLNYFEIDKPQESFHEHNASVKIPGMIEKLHDGLSIAQVSDAGLPSISDPGHDLVKVAIEESIPVVALPGASAGITALIASGISPQPHIFYGFLPRKKNQQIAFFQEKMNYPESQIFYESPFRVADTLENMLEVYGDRQINLVRELTKIYEEYRRGTISEVLTSIEEFPIKGECLIIVEGSDGLEKPESDFDSLSIKEEIDSYIEDGDKTNVAIKKTAKRRQLTRQDVYKEYHEIED